MARKPKPRWNTGSGLPRFPRPGRRPAPWAVAGSRITHQATYDDPKVKDMDAKTDGYFTLMKDDGKLFAGAPPYPFHAQVREATAPFFYEAITGELSPSDALDKMAAPAEADLTKLGYRK